MPHVKRLSLSATSPSPFGQHEPPWLLSRPVTDTPFESYMRAQLPAARDLMEELEKLVREVVPDATVAIKWNVPVFSRGSILCFMDARREDVKFGFWSGAALAKKHPILTGDGSLLRHVRITKLTASLKKQLRAVLRDALANAEAANAKKKAGIPLKSLKAKASQVKASTSGDPRKLSDLVSIGPAMLRDFELLGVKSIDDLKRRDPMKLYKELSKRTNTKQDPCVLDTFVAAVAQAKDPKLPKAKCNWWYWSKIRKAAEKK